MKPVLHFAAEAFAPIVDGSDPVVTFAGSEPVAAAAAADSDAAFAVVSQIAVAAGA